MENFFAFANAALPWVAVGLLLAVFCARGAGKKKSGKEEKTENYGTEGMCLGMCFGTAIGTALGNNTGLGISLGMLIGLAVGSAIEKKARGDSDDQK
ncbi:MAG: hypothetical protein SPE18_00435 [Candidatus Limivicinus sp.]|nr:hypothetical protein [Candidatus Limivicinus sp.]